MLRQDILHLLVSLTALIRQGPITRASGHRVGRRRVARVAGPARGSIWGAGFAGETARDARCRRGCQVAATGKGWRERRFGFLVLVDSRPFAPIHGNRRHGSRELIHRPRGLLNATVAEREISRRDKLPIQAIKK